MYLAYVVLLNLIMIKDSEV